MHYIHYDESQLHSEAFLPAEPSALQKAYALHSNSEKNSWLSLYISSMLNSVNNESSFSYIIYACE